MRRALDLAGRGRGRVEPNPMVGAVVVRDGHTVAEGWHERFGGPHAEASALRRAGAEARGATLYVTLEPCTHEGKTPPCAPQVVEAGVGRLVVAALDPTAKVHGKGVWLCRERGIEVEVGVCRAEAVWQNAGFFKLTAVRRPLVTGKWAMSADGKAATRAGDSRWVSSAESRRIVHEERGRTDCVMVGAGTAAADDPLLTCRDAERRRVAARLVVCGARAIPAASRLTSSTAEGPIILTFPAGREPSGLADAVGAGCEALPVEASAEAPERVDLTALLDELGRRGMTNVLVEGGGRLLGSLLDEGLLDRVMIFIAPVLVGGAEAAPVIAGRGVEKIAGAHGLRHATWRRVGPDMLLEGWLADPLGWDR